MKKLLILTGALWFGFSCTEKSNDENTIKPDDGEKSEIQMKVDEYATFRLTADLSGLSENQKKMIPILIEAANIMDDVFWQEA